MDAVSETFNESFLSMRLPLTLTFNLKLMLTVPPPVVCGSHINIAEVFGRRLLFFDAVCVVDHLDFWVVFLAVKPKVILPQFCLPCQQQLLLLRLLLRMRCLLLLRVL